MPLEDFRLFEPVLENLYELRFRRFFGSFEPIFSIQIRECIAKIRKKILFG